MWSFMTMQSAFVFHHTRLTLDSKKFVLFFVHLHLFSLHVVVCNATHMPGEKWRQPKALLPHSLISNVLQSPKEYNTPHGQQAVFLEWLHLHVPHEPPLFVNLHVHYLRTLSCKARWAKITVVKDSTYIQIVPVIFAALKCPLKTKRDHDH